MIRPGEVRGVRELSRGVQAQVCLGADVKTGSAVITVETTDPAVMKALDALKLALLNTASTYMADVMRGQRAWEDAVTKAQGRAS